VNVVAVVSAKGPLTTPLIQVVPEDRSSLGQDLQKPLCDAVKLVEAVVVLLQCVDQAIDLPIG
jgi:hypothetical protein